MNSSRRVTGYDLFKLIIAIVLLILFLLLNKKTTPGTPPPVFTPFSEENGNPVPVSLTQPFQTELSPAQATTTGLPLSTPIQAVTPIRQLTHAETSTAEVTVTPLLSPASTLSIEPTGTTQPSPTSTSAASLTSTPGAVPIAITACDSASSHSRLKAGGKAVLLRRLNFRSSPGIQENWLRTNPAGTKVEVMDGPQCIPYVNGAYIWWQIRLPDGQVGWSAEASRFGSFYFMEPGE